MSGANLIIAAAASGAPIATPPEAIVALIIGSILVSIGAIICYTGPVKPTTLYAGLAFALAGILAWVLI
jgi:hypothetical protein